MMHLGRLLRFLRAHYPCGFWKLVAGVWGLLEFVDNNSLSVRVFVYVCVCERARVLSICLCTCLHLYKALCLFFQR